MKIKNKYKHYIYIRDDQRCFFCNRKVSFKKMSMDHYQPKSKGGSSNVFNIVTCCQVCNRNKGTDLPKDYKLVQMDLFRKAIEDHIFKVQLDYPLESIKSLDEKTTEFKTKNQQIIIRENEVYKDRKSQ